MTTPPTPAIPTAEEMLNVDFYIQKFLSDFKNVHPSSADYYSQTGNVSGSMYTGVKMMLKECAQAHARLHLEAFAKEMIEARDEFDSLPERTIEEILNDYIAKMK